MNRPTGTIETNVMTSVGKSTIREFFIGKVLPSVQSKWPSEDPNKIIISSKTTQGHILIIMILSFVKLPNSMILTLG